MSTGRLTAETEYKLYEALVLVTAAAEVADHQHNIKQLHDAITDAQQAIALARREGIV